MYKNDRVAGGERARANRRRTAVSIVIAATLVLGVLPVPVLAATTNMYTIHPLVSDVATMAPVVDPNLVNGWGLAAGPLTPWWVSDNGMDRSTVYDGAGVPRSLVVTVASAPTGIVYNGTTSFPVHSGNATEPARFLWATENGTILGWHPDVPAPGSTTAFIVKDRSGVGAVYKGLAIGSFAGKPYIYASDFVNGRVDVFNGSFVLQNWRGAFVDRSLPRHYAPFGIQAIGSHIFVSYARQNLPSHDEAAGPGRGVVNEFDMRGRFIRRVAMFGVLNAPWGLAMSPAGFGRFSNCLLVGNFGNGRINAYAKNRNNRWVFQGTLRKDNGAFLVIDGLWGIAFGRGAFTPSGCPNTLYFAAGPEDESHGLFGAVTAP